jgi:hypothetical protein
MTVLGEISMALDSAVMGAGKAWVEGGSADRNTARHKRRRTQASGSVARLVSAGRCAACCHNVVRILSNGLLRSETSSPRVKVSVYRPSDSNPYIARHVNAELWSTGGRDFAPISLPPTPRRRRRRGATARR